MKKSISPPNKSFLKIKFLSDECIGLPIISLLRELGYAAVTVKEVNLNGKSDTDIIKWATKEEYILITEDTDFGNIILYPPHLHHGVILLRFRHKLEFAIHNTLAVLLDELKPDDFNKTLIIVDADKYRLRKE